MFFKGSIVALGLVDAALFARDMGASYGEAGQTIGAIAIVVSLKALAKFMDLLEARGR